MTTREEYLKRLNEYIHKNTFAPFVLGFFGMSGTIGQRRSKRAHHLLSIASKVRLRIEESKTKLMR